MKLKLSKDRKTTPKAKQSGSSWTPEIPNAFGLPAHISCPGMTDVCKSICYAFSLERAYTNVNLLLKHNWDLLQSKGNAPTKIALLLEELIQDYLAGHERVERLRDTDYPKIFRIHWDGDFYSIAYAKAWAKVIKDHPEIQFWAYTRSFKKKLNVVPHLADIDNLALYLSIDEDNMKDASVVLTNHPTVKSAFLGTTFDQAREYSLETIDKASPKCPEQTGYYPLVLDTGEGACSACNMCINGTNDVLFSISKK